MENTIEFIEKFTQIINLHFKFEEETAKQEDLSHKQLTKISEIRNNTQTIQEFFDNYTSSEFGMTQLRIAETEKYAHVTFFFNGGVEEPYKGEDRILRKIGRASCRERV